MHTGTDRRFLGVTNSRVHVASIIFFIVFIAFLSLVAFALLQNSNEKESLAARLLTSNSLRVGILGSDSQSVNLKKRASILLIEALADQFHWKLQVTSFSSLSDMYTALDEEAIDVIADAVIDHRIPYNIRYSISYAKTRPRLIYFPEASQEIASKQDFTKNQLLLIENSWQSHFATNLSYVYQDLQWQEFPDFWSLEDMIYTIQSPPGGYLLVIDEELEFYRHNYPDLQTGLSFDSVSLAFVFNKEAIALERFVSTFIESHTRNNNPTKFISKSSLQAFLRPGELAAFLTNITNRFPQYAHLFFAAAQKYNLDWRLIAAVAYQESLWNEEAVSPTGVKGLMMLTNATARFMKVSDRTHPEQSVDGGTRYLLYLKKLLPERITEPDKTWLALAAYNIGPAHLEDIRIITEKHGKNPDLWMDVREFLPYIEEPEWYQQSKHGYGRGREAQKYVDNIRNYYQVLINLRTTIESPEPTLKEEEPNIQVRHQVERIQAILPHLISLKY